MTFSNCDSLITQPPNASDFFTNVECPAFFIGDITQDGSANVLDLVLLVSWIINGVNPSEIEIADIVNDGTLDIFDIILLCRNYIIKYINV